jgi:hypothetical protein
MNFAQRRGEHAPVGFEVRGFATHALMIFQQRETQELAKAQPQVLSRSKNQRDDQDDKAYQRRCGIETIERWEHVCTHSLCGVWGSGQVESESGETYPLRDTDLRTSIHQDIAAG